MKTVDIKKRLIEKIKLSDNKDLLEEFYQFLNLENEMQETYTLSEAQHSAVAEARSQIEKGVSLTHKEANEEIDKWLGE